MEEEKQTVQVRSTPTAEEVKPTEADVVRKLTELGTQTQLMMRIRKNMKAHSSGDRAQACGFARVSPFYEDAVSDDFFFKGFDGVSFDEAIRTPPEE